MTLSKRKNLTRQALTFMLFTLPAVISIVFVVEIPFIMSITYSFTKWNGLDKLPQFIGLDNYIELLTDDKDMGHAMIFTLTFTVLMVVLTNIISLFLAVILDTKIRGRNVLRAVFYIPNIMSMIVIGYIWRFIFSKAFESLYAITGLEVFQLSWLGDSQLAFISIVIVSVWQALGFYMVIYIAGLQTVPTEINEAAIIDGANVFQKFRHITLPMIMPSITVCVFYALSNALKSFDVIFSLTFGGPGSATTSIALDIYKTAFSNSRFGYGAAKSVVLFLIILVITVLQVTVFKKREVEV